METKNIIITAIAIIVVIGVAASVFTIVNQNTMETLPVPTQTQEPQSQSVPPTETSQPTTQLAVQIADEKREFIPSPAKFGTYSEYTPEEMAARERVLREILGDNYDTIADRSDKLTAPMYLDVAINPTGKAAIIDMLWDKLPNRDFLQKSNDILAKGGYSVDIYLTNDATLDLYKKLPSMNYDYIVWRTHGLAQGAIENSATIYSGEVWESGKYYNEQLTGQIKFGVPYTPAEVAEIGWEKLGPETYYTIGSTFVEQAMQGEFDDTVILIGGCDALSGKILANSLIDRGASIVIGWTDIIGAYENDEAILLILEELLIDKTVPEYAAKNASEKLTKHPMFKDTRLAFVSKNI